MMMRSVECGPATRHKTRFAGTFSEIIAGRKRKAGAEQPLALKMSRNVHSPVQDTDDCDRSRICLVDDEMRLVGQDEIARFDIINPATVSYSAG
jgi:hypothetical protein